VPPTTHYVPSIHHDVYVHGLAVIHESAIGFELKMVVWRSSGAMYDPRQPNSYDAVMSARATARQQSVTAAAATTAATVPGGVIQPTPLDNELEKALAQHAPASMADMTPEDMRRLRVAASARLGVQSAMAMERDDHEAAVKERKALGLDSSSKASKFLKLMGVGEGQALPAAGGGLTSHLVMEKSAMPGGGNVLVQSSGPTKAQVKGKPSAALLLRNVAAPDATSTDALQLDMQTECAKFGVVKYVRVHQLGTLPDGWHPGEGVRVFVRFDSVASAFKAAEALHHRVYDGRNIVVSFVPTITVERGELQPTSEEDRLPVG
jgi:hypothetical protein